MRSIKLPLAIKIGLLAGFFSSIPNYIAFIFNEHLFVEPNLAGINLIVQVFTPIISGIIAALIIKRQNEGRISFSKVMITLLTTVSIAVAVNVFLFLILFILSSGFMQRYASMQNDIFLQRMKEGLMTAKNYSDYTITVHKNSFLSVLVTQTITFNLLLIFVSALVSLIIATIIRKEK